MITRIENEIVELHQFFQDWYNNQLTPTDENFARCANVLAPNFAIIFPDGHPVLCKPLLHSLRNAHNTHVNMRIWIKNIQVLHQCEDQILATYEEWQEITDQVTARVSSALFQKAPAAPNGVVWLHVHETWIEPGSTTKIDPNRPPKRNI